VKSVSFRLRTTRSANELNNHRSLSIRYSGTKQYNSTMSELTPKSNSDERDPAQDLEDEKQRDAQLQEDKPPHHD